MADKRVGRMPLTTLFGFISKTATLDISPILDLFNQRAASSGDRYPRILGYLLNGGFESDVSELERRPVSSVMGAISLQRRRTGFDSTYLLESPDGRRISILIDGAPRTVRRLDSKYQNFSEKIRFNLDWSKVDLRPRESLAELVSLWAQDFPSGFVLVVSDGERILISRDPLGIRQVYLGEGKGLVGFATDESFFSGLGFSSTEELEVGGHVSLSRQGIKKVGGASLPYNGTSIDAFYASAEELLETLTMVVSEELSGYDRVGVAFSGGLDSSIIAKIASTTGVETRLYVVGLLDSHDLLFAERAAGWLGLPLETIPFSIEDVESNLIQVISFLGINDLVEISIALPIYLAFKSMKEEGLSAVLSGQGADEVFGGYLRHLLTLRKQGHTGLSCSLRNDTSGTCIRNVERERRIARSNRLEVFYPYLDLEVLRIGLNISPGLKIFGIMDLLRKAVLREVGRRLNLPRCIIYRKKSAVQYGSGSLKVIRRLAKKRGSSVNEYLLSLKEESST